MARTLGLRTITQEQAQLQQCVAALQAHGWTLDLRTLQVPCGYVSFEATHKGQVHQGWMDVAQVLRSIYPELDELAWRAVDTRYVLDLIHSVGHPHAFAALPAPAGGWERITPRAIVSEPLAEQSLLCFESGTPDTPNTPIYFRGFPVPRLAVADDPRAHVPVVLQCRIGTSMLPAALLSQIESGDALLIQQTKHIITVGGKPFCYFQYEGESIVLDEQFDEYEEDYTAEDDSDETAPHDDTQSTPVTVEALPVRLEFVLQEESFNFADLSLLRPGFVLPLQANAATNVKVRANGRLIATGELIQVGEQLAVQVQSTRLPSSR